VQWAIQPFICLMVEIVMRVDVDMHVGVPS
jgi:hypothetical protein